eukprot:TRINITY_DN112594_c0_g1_i1.p1 TRINITY_DN112594_c0_g1~~TRINITY_DN112594_c0_g1_i1.p1  ORF type:complete len:223 (-),score=13.40 TRINITY_DN112594_c0_g1_i1:177-845(-)
MLQTSHHARTEHQVQLHWKAHHWPTDDHCLPLLNCLFATTTQTPECHTAEHMASYGPLVVPHSHATVNACSLFRNQFVNGYGKSSPSPCSSTDDQPSCSSHDFPVFVVCSQQHCRATSVISVTRRRTTVRNQPLHQVQMPVFSSQQQRSGAVLVATTAVSPCPSSHWTIFKRPRLAAFSNVPPNLVSDVAGTPALINHCLPVSPAQLSFMARHRLVQPVEEP